MRQKHVLSTELFQIPYKDRFIVYAPLKRLAFCVNAKAIELLTSLATKPNSAVLSPEETRILERFVEVGVLDGASDEVPMQTSPVFLPDCVSLFLTTRCNLRCVYCYACGGETDDAELDVDIAKEAINLVVTNATSRKQNSFGVAFHGGGEPTLAWNALTRCVAHAKERAKETGLNVNLSIATNGVMSRKKVDFLVQNFNSLTLSMDGLEEAHDTHRPLSNGTGSFGDVLSTMRRMNESGFPFAIRTTVTALNVLALDRFVTFLRQFRQLRHIQLEPVYSCGRCVSTGTRAPSGGDFVREFRKAHSAGRATGVSVLYSGARAGTCTTTFCKACGNSFCVAPDGSVSSCYEVCSRSDPRSGLFFFGKWNSTERLFVFDAERLARLQRQTVIHVDHCSDCFCKYSCAGDCLAKTIATGNEQRVFDAGRCSINRALTLDQILRSLGVGESSPFEIEVP